MSGATAALARIAALAVAVCASGCERRPAAAPDAGSARTLAGAPCPPERVLELLHDAIFHLERGDDDARVNAELARVRELAGPGAGLDPLLQDAQAALDAGTQRTLRAEELRAELHGSGCIPDDVHQRFHQALPPVR